MTNALHDCFHNADFLLCTKHIKDNLQRFLEKSGTSLKDRLKISKIIFDEDGVVFSKDNLEYCTKLEDLEQYFESYPKFKTYWQRYLEQKIQRHVLEPLQRKLICSLWTNNNSESINNRIKQVAEFKQHSLPDLVQKLALVSKIQMLDLRRALHGTGNFKLSGNSKTFLLSQDSWNEKTLEEKDQYFRKFLATKLKNKTVTINDNFVKASGSEFQCPKPKQSCGRKPGQRKRSKSERTRTIKRD